STAQRAPLPKSPRRWASCPDPRRATPTTRRRIARARVVGWITMADYETIGAAALGRSRAGADLLADRVESGAGVLAQRGDRCQANDDDQRQHHGVFDCRRAVFALDEVYDAVQAAVQHW